MVSIEIGNIAIDFTIDRETERELFNFRRFSGKVFYTLEFPKTTHLYRFKNYFINYYVENVQTYFVSYYFYSSRP